MDQKDDNSFSGHKLNGSNYKLWKFQISACMKGHALLNNIEGKVPVATATQDEKEKYEKNEEKAMSIIIQSLDIERAHLVLSCKTAKEMMDKLKSVYEKNSDIRVMTLYEEYFVLKMRDDEEVASYVAKVSQMASDIEGEGEKLSEKLKMVRIISSLSPKFNNFETVWYSNASENRTLDISVYTLMSSLRLEEDNLKRIDDEKPSSSDVAYAVKFNHGALKKVSLDDIKRRSKCHACGGSGHWARDKQCPKKKTFNSDKSSELAWCSTIYAENEENLRSEEWCADSGASSHMTYHREWFVSFTKYDGNRTVKVANNSHLKIRGIGTILIEAKVNNQWEPRRLEKVLYVPEIKENLFSTAVVTDKGFSVLIESRGCTILDNRKNAVAVGKREQMNQLKMDIRVCKNEAANSAAIPLQHWHQRLGHINVQTIKRMCQDCSVEGINLSDQKKFFCEDCQLGKITRSSHEKSIKRPSVKGEYMHADLCGPMEVSGIGGFRYFMLIKDEATTFRFIYLLKTKDEVYECLSGFIPMVHNMIGTRIKNFRFDNGTEFINSNVTTLLEKEGIQVEKIVPYTPEQNGRIERDNRTIQESARTMLIASGLPKTLWSEAVRTATYLLNRTTNSQCIGTTPYEKWFERKPWLGHVKIFGTECFMQVPKQLGRKKWDPKGKKVFLTGFESTIKNFRLYDPSNGKIVLSCDVRFNEMACHAQLRIEDKPKDFVNREDKYKISFLNEDDRIIEDINDKNDNNNERNNEEDFFEDAVNDADSAKNNIEVDFDKRGHSTIERGDDIISSINKDAVQTEGSQVQHRYNLRSRPIIETGYSAMVVEPNNYGEAIKSAEVEKWKSAMNEEYDSLIKNHTWDLVKPPENQKVIDNRWVYKVKQNTDGTIERYKARLVVRGFTQQYGVDYEETFSPVVKFTSIRTILSLATMNRMHMKQFDVKTAFLYGDLKENVYMKQPIGYEDQSGRVCKLVKSLYGLKQASRCWNQKFTSFIRKFNFKVSSLDPCVFIRNDEENIAIIAIYVDDGLIVSNHSDEIVSIISYLKQHFEIKVFEARCYLGLEIEHLSDGSIHIHQQAYIRKVLQRFGMIDSKIV